MRDYLRARPSYINSVLTDTLARIVFVSVAKRLVKANAVVAPIAALAEPLGRWSLDLDTFRTIAEAELSHKLSEPFQRGADTPRPRAPGGRFIRVGEEGMVRLQAGLEGGARGNVRYWGVR